MFTDLTGKTFGYLTVIERCGTDSRRNVLWKCKCTCGKFCVIPSCSLLKGLTRSCGCMTKSLISLKNTANILGKKFGRLTVFERAKSDRNRNALWNCICECGNVCTVSTERLRSGTTRSCGCLRKETNTRRLTKWKTDEEQDLVDCLSGMMQRCYNPNNSAYEDYGARGIFVCEEWRDPTNGRRNFINWAMSNGFKRGLTIERKNEGKYHKEQNGPYAPWNCTWIPKERQATNRRSSIDAEIDGVVHTIADWARLSGLNYSHLHYLYTKGYCLFRDAVIYNLKTFAEQKDCYEKRGYETIQPSEKKEEVKS